MKTKKTILKKSLLDKEGSVSVEAVFAMSFFMIFFLLTIAFFTFMYPQISLQKEVSALATITERQGGLTELDIEEFRNSLQGYKFISDSPNSIIVEAETSPSGILAIGVTPIGEEGENYISRDSKEIIRLKVKIPSNSGYLKRVGAVFGIKNVSDYYYFTEPVMSERY